MSVVDPKLIKEAQTEIGRIITSIIDQWDRLKRRREGVSERCCLLSIDSSVYTVSDFLSQSASLNNILERFLALENYGELWDVAISEVSQLGSSYEMWFKNVTAQQLALLLSLSPVYSPRGLLNTIYVIRDKPRIELTFLDLAESIVLQHVLSRSTVAHIYLYGSSRFRRQAIEAREEMEKAGEDFNKFHENAITKKAAPAIYSFLSAMNLASSVVDEEIDKYPILGKIVVSGGLRAKVVVQTGVGASLSKALIHGVAKRTNFYIPSFYISALIGNVLVAQLWDFATREGEITNVVKEAFSRLESINTRIIAAMKKAHKLSLRELRSYYEVTDAIRDAAIISIIINTQRKKGNEVELSDIFRII